MLISRLCDGFGFGFPPCLRVYRAVRGSKEDGVAVAQTLSVVLVSVCSADGSTDVKRCPRQCL